MHHQGMVELDTIPRELHDITRDVQGVVSKSDCDVGVCHLLLLHTSAGLVLQENADSSVQRDLERFLARLVPDSTTAYEHSAEGPDDMPSHIRSMLSNVALTIPVRDGRLLLGTWQGIYVWEHRTSPHRRRVAVHVSW